MNLHQRLLSRIRTRTELSDARLQLAATRSDYRNGNFSGHPEGKLEVIEHLQRAVDRLLKVIADKKDIDYAALDRTTEELDSLYAVARNGKSTRDLMDRAVELQHRWHALASGN